MHCANNCANNFSWVCVSCIACIIDESEVDTILICSS